jgi:hypothetical protein
LGIFWLLLGTLDLIFGDAIQIFGILYLAIGLLLVSHYVYDLKHQYLIIDNHTIQKNFLYGGWNRKIKFEDIESVEKSYLNFTLKTKTTQLKINADLIEEKSYKEFKTILLSLNLPESNMPTLY